MSLLPTANYSPVFRLLFWCWQQAYFKAYTGANHQGEYM